jgi:hypothetical protein
MTAYRIDPEPYRDANRAARLEKAVAGVGLKADWTGSGDAIKALYREKAKHRHSDHDGDDTLMAELNVAYDEAKRELGVK